MTPKTSHKHAIIFGTELNSTPKTKVLRTVRDNLSSFGQDKPGHEKLFIVTPNPEIVSLARKDKVLRKVINSSTYSLPDGVGLIQAMKYLSLSAPKNKILRLPVVFYQGILVGLATFFNKEWLNDSFNLIKGRELFMDFIKLANKKSWRVYLLGGEGRVSEKVANSLNRSFKKVKIEASDGPRLTSDGNPATKRDIKVEKDTVKKINKFNPHMLFVAFGAPKQEKWVAKTLPDLSIGMAMVVGGTFDYIAGKAETPPKWMESLGLEWLWRLFKEPKRIGRVFRAFPLFPLNVFLYKLTKQAN